MSYILLPNKDLKDLDDSIQKGKQFLAQTYKSLLQLKDNIYDYDGGVTILMALMKSKYNVDIGLKFKDCHNLSLCAKEAYKSTTSYKFNITDEDIFGTSFLKKLYLEGNNVNNELLNELTTYLDTYQRFQMEGLVSFFNIQNQTYYRFINVGLAIAYMEQNNLTNMQGYKLLKEKVVNGLLGVFHNEKQLEGQYLDPMKAMSLWILFMLEKVDNKKEIDSYIRCVIKEQASNGQWINSDVFDGNNLVNDLILTSISIMNLVAYKQMRYNNNNNNNNQINDMKDNREIYYGEDGKSFYVDQKEPLYIDSNIKKQEYGLTAIESNELFKNIGTEKDNVMSVGCFWHCRKDLYSYFTLILFLVISFNALKKSIKR
jgi:hypothetical protein